jgi:hypothetical protein
MTGSEIDRMFATLNRKPAPQAAAPVPSPERPLIDAPPAASHPAGERRPAQRLRQSDED